jgi:hypothetical protein
MLRHLIACAIVAGLAAGESPALHLVILSGQSNMAGIDADKQVRPRLEELFPGDRVAIAKQALGATAIKAWYQGWQEPAGWLDGVAGRDPKLFEKLKGEWRDAPNGRLWPALTEAIAKACPDPARATTVTFCWMQGERDARQVETARIYEASLTGLIAQVRTHLGRPEAAVVIGRLNPLRVGSEPWDLIRAAQQRVAEADPRAAWVDTDDLPRGTGGDAIHHTADGYLGLGRRFAEATARLAGKTIPAGTP